MSMEYKSKYDVALAACDRYEKPTVEAALRQALEAITMKRGKPRIDRSVCIHCFCCQEFCPKGAMKVGRTRIGKIISKKSARP